MSDEVQDMNASLAQVAEVSKCLEALVKDLPVLVQLDALLSTYVKLGKATGQLDKVGTALVELGGSILYSQFVSPPPARCSVPASNESKHHPAPPIVQ